MAVSMLVDETVYSFAMEEARYLCGLRLILGYRRWTSNNL